jgi:hypothetical protein
LKKGIFVSLKHLSVLRSRIGDLERKLNEAKNEYRDALRKYRNEKYGVRPGDLIFDTRKGCGHQYEFSHFDDLESIEWVYARKIRKDGTPSLMHTCLYTDWRKP